MTDVDHKESPEKTTAPVRTYNLGRAAAIVIIVVSLEVTLVMLAWIAPDIAKHFLDVIPWTTPIPGAS